MWWGLCVLSLQFQLSYSDKQRYEMEERPDVQKQILVDIARKLPIFTRAQSGGKISSQPIFCLLFSCQYIIFPVVLLTISEPGKLATYCQIGCNLCSLKLDRLGDDQAHSEHSLKACLSLLPVIKGNSLASGGGWRVGSAQVSLIHPVLIFSPAIRFCDRCQVLKPDRCHHCSVCET